MCNRKGLELIMRLINTHIFDSKLMGERERANLVEKFFLPLANLVVSRRDFSIIWSALCAAVTAVLPRPDVTTRAPRKLYDVNFPYIPG